MFQAFNESFVYELKSIGHSWYKLMLITLLPLLSFGLIISIFHSGVVRNLPVAVVDADYSKLSRMLTNHIDASPTMKVAFMPQNTKEAVALLKAGKVYAFVHIPAHFSKETLLKKNPKVTAMINTQYILIGKMLTSALTKTVMYSSEEVEYVEKLVEGQQPEVSLNNISPIGMQITSFFNTYQNYFYFLVSALLPAIWQIFIVIASLVAIGVIFKAKEEQTFFKTDGKIAVRLMGLLFPYTLSFMLLGILYTLYIYSHWVFQGSLAFLFIGMFMTVIAYQAIALLLFATSFDYARSLSLGAVYTAPAFAFLGITFPIYNMNGFALFWRDLLPISHYTQLQLSQANYGVSIWSDTDKLLTILAFWLLFIPVLFLFKRRLRKGNL